MKKILVSGASGIVGYGILRSLKSSGRDLELFGSTIYEDSVAEAFCDRFLLAPRTSDPNYLEWLRGAINEFDLDLIIPGIDADMHFWVENLKEIETLGPKILVNRPNLVSLTKDKWKFFEHLASFQTGIEIESTLENDYSKIIEKFGPELILKPRYGFGSKGIIHVKDREAFESHKSEIGEKLLVQPYTGDVENEFSTSAFCDGEGGFYAHLTLRRKLSSEGFTEKAEVCEDSKILNAVKNLCKIFRPIGPTNFQFRLDNGTPKLLEINPRISSATSIRTGFGFNESSMAIDFFLYGKEPVQPELKEGRAVRYVEDHFFLK